mgnify:CR=1 FL=1
MSEFLKEHFFKITTGILLVLLVACLFRCSGEKSELKVSKQENEVLRQKNGELLIQRETACREAIEAERARYQSRLDSLRAQSDKVIKKAPRPVEVRTVDIVYRDTSLIKDSQVILEKKDFEKLKAYQDSSVIYIESLVKTIRDKDSEISMLTSKNNVTQLQIDNANASVQSMEAKMDAMVKSHEKEVKNVRRWGWFKAGVGFVAGFVSGRI